MQPRQAAVAFSSFFACYLIFSLSFVLAYEVGDFFNNGKVRLALEPVMKITDDIKPLTCASSGSVILRAYIENIPEFDIASIDASVYDASNEIYYNVTSAVSCGPRTGLISNQEFTCTVNIKELLTKLPKCPLESMENAFYLTAQIAYGKNKEKATDSKTLTIINQGTKPEMEINFAVSRPAYPVPEINCKTGSEIDVPVVIHNAEAMFGSIGWSYAAGNITSSQISCNKMLSRENEGRDDIYLCTLTVPSTLFPKCEDGADVTVLIGARTNEYNLNSSFTTILVSQELQLALKVSGMKNVDCQIINEDGTCVPKEPQRNVTVTITGNAPEKLKVFESEYKLGSEAESTVSCRQISTNRYECATFITIDKLPVPKSKDETTNASRDLAVTFDVKYLNYYKTITSSTKVTMEGKALDELIDTMQTIDEESKFLKIVNDIVSALQKAIGIVNIVSKCCTLPNMLNQLGQKVIGKEASKKTLSEFVKAFVENKFENYMLKNFGIDFAFKKAFGTYAKKVFEYFAKKFLMDLLLNTIKQIGIQSLWCIASGGLQVMDDQKKNLDKFEKGEINSMNVPQNFFDYVWELIKSKAPDCFKQSFWSQFKDTSKLLGYLCILVGFVLTYFFPAAMSLICSYMSTGAGILDVILNVAVIIISLLTAVESYNRVHKAVALATERINLQTKASNIMQEYSTDLQNTMQNLLMSQMSAATFSELFNPPTETVKLIFYSGRTGILNQGDDVCSGDDISIEYNFDKLNQTGSFSSQLHITNSHSKTLRFEGLNGTYGPYNADTLLGANPSQDPSEDYTFTLSYGDKSLDYKLHYVNHECVS